MLDPLSALGLASNIAQLIDISVQVVSQSHDFIQSSGDALPRNEVLAQLAKDNRDLASEISCINRADQPLTRYEAAARDAAAHCSHEAAALLSELETLQVKRHSNKFLTRMRAMSQSFRTEAKRNVLQILEKKLQARESQLGTALLQLILHRQDVKFDELKHWMHQNDIQDGRSLLLLTQDMKQMLDQQHRTLQNESKIVQNGVARLEEWHEELVTAIGERDYELKKKLILGSLRFADMDYRRTSIPESHRKTFEWCFHKSQSPFQDWLEHGDGIFWVCGKAGSGKSTLMKFLCSDKRTRRSLRVWSKDCTLISAEHYFWYAGTPLQKSLQGLLQSILYQILSSVKDTNLVSTLCRERWDQKTADLGVSWTPEELAKAIEAVEACSEIKICVFIDGLDEYHPQGEHRQLIKQLKTFAGISNLKFCVSSRPWTAFSEEFGDLAHQISLEDLTSADIAQYVRDHLQTAAPVVNLSFGALRSSDLDELVRLVTGKAKGVFLWVYLVVSALEERLSTQSNLKQLLKCVQEFPSELEDYFRYSIYERIHKTWRNDTAEALTMAILFLQHRSRLQVPEDDDRRALGYLGSFLPFWLLRNGIDSPDFAFTMAIKFVTQREVDNMIQATMQHLNACCKDFLHFYSSVEKRSYYIFRSSPKNQIRTARVTVLHRTVYDFLCSDEMDRLLDANVPKFFKSNGFLFRVSIACIKVIMQTSAMNNIGRRNESLRMDLCPDFVETLYTTLPKTPPMSSEPTYKTYLAAMKEIDGAGLQYVQSTCNGHCWDGVTESFKKFHLLLFDQLIACRLHSYVKAVIATSAVTWVKFDGQYSMLLSALGLSSGHPFRLHEIDLALVEFLLQHGANANQYASGIAEPICVHAECSTVWTNFLHAWFQRGRESTGYSTTAATHRTDGDERIWAIAVLLMSHHADLEKKFCFPDPLVIHREQLTGSPILSRCVPEAFNDQLDEILQVTGAVRQKRLESTLTTLRSPLTSP